MKRVLSLLVVLAMVIAMVPSVFAAKEEIEFDELLGKLVKWEDITENAISLDEGVEAKNYEWTPATDGTLSLVLTGAAEGTEVNYTVSQGETTVEAVDGKATIDVVAGTKVIIKVSEANKAAVTATMQGTFTKYNNTADAPILVDFVWNEEQTEATATVTAEPGTTYFGQYRIGGMALSINGGEPFIVESQGMMYPGVFTITNDGDAAAEYTLTLSYPVGSRMNPEVLEELNYYWGDVALEEGNGEGYYYTYTAPADGSIQMYFGTVTEGVTADIVVNNMATYEQKSLLADGVDNFGLELTVEVSEGDQLMIQIVVMPDENWNVPAAEISWFGNFSYPAGTEQNPIQPEWVWNDAETEATATVTVPAGETVYVSTYGGMYLSINDGEGTLMKSAGFFAPPPVFTLTNDGEAAADFALKIWYPAGVMMNPDKLVIGENTAEIGEGSDGYFYTWTAEANGNLTITMPEGNWTYALNNLTTGIYGDMQYSDSDPVLNPGTISVKEGDEIQLIVNTYDPEVFWGAPAGTLVITAAFEEVKYIVGDLDGNEEVTEQDAIYLLRHVLFYGITGQYPVDQPVDYNKDGDINEQDAIYLLRHVLFYGITGQYPLT